MNSYFKFWKKTWLPKRICHGNTNIDAYVATTSRRSQIIFRKNGKVGKYGGHSFNGFEVTQFLREGWGGGGWGGAKSPSGHPVWKGLNFRWPGWKWIAALKKMVNYLKLVFLCYQKMSAIIDRKNCSLRAFRENPALNIILLEFQVRQKMAENTYLELG